MVFRKTESFNLIADLDFIFFGMKISFKRRHTGALLWLSAVVTHRRSSADKICTFTVTTLWCDCDPLDNCCNVQKAN